MSGRVRIGTCSGPADAALIRSVFAARGLHVVIGAEHHGGMFAGLGAFLSLDIWVAAEDAEDAAELLQDLRESDASEPSPDGDDGDAADAGDTADEDAADPADHARAEADDPAAAAAALSIEQRSLLRRNTAYVLLLGGVFGFGTAHLFTGAWGRGFFLAALQIAGFVSAISGSSMGLAVLAAARLVDLFGALWRVRTAPTTALPVARIRP